MTSSERMLNTLRGEPTDRVSVIVPYKWHPADATADSVPAWQKSRNFELVREKSEELADLRVQLRSTAPLFDRLLLLAPSSIVEVLPDQEVPKGFERRTVVHTPDGDLSMVDLITKGPPLEHKWRTEPLVKSPEDAEALGVVDGQPVRVTTEAGSEVGELQVSEQIRKGTVLIPHGFGLIYGDTVYGLNVNKLTKTTHRDPLGTPMHRFVPCRIEAAA